MLLPRILRGKCIILLACSFTSRYTPKATGTQFPDNTRSNQPGHSNYSTQLDLNGILNHLKEQAGSLSSATTLGLTEVGGRLTGYEHIEGLKCKVVETGAMLFMFWPEHDLMAYFVLGQRLPLQPSDRHPGRPRQLM